MPYHRVKCREKTIQSALVGCIVFSLHIRRILCNFFAKPKLTLLLYHNDVPQAQYTGNHYRLFTKEFQQKNVILTHPTVRFTE